jgi:hypothetical protein
VSAIKPPPTREAAAEPAAVKSPRPRKKKGPALPKALAIGGEEPATPVSESPHVHAPQHGIHTWRDFTVHIAVVTIGLLLAIGLQQIVEAVHHRSERAHLEEQMHGTFVANKQLIADNVEKLRRLQEYLADLRSTVGARIEGRSARPAPAESDPRNFGYVPPPSLGAYEAAKANGSVALLSFDTIRLYDRLGITIGIMHADLERYLGATNALRAFAERFDATAVSPYQSPQVNLARLSAEELVEYRVLIGNLIGAAGSFKNRLRILELSSRAILDGAQTEADLRAAIAKLQGDPSDVAEAVGGNAP